MPVRQEPWFLETGGVCCVDEFDKMTSEHQVYQILFYACISGYACSISYTYCWPCAIGDVLVSPTKTNYFYASTVTKHPSLVTVRKVPLPSRLGFAHAAFVVINRLEKLEAILTATRF